MGGRYGVRLTWGHPVSSPARCPARCRRIRRCCCRRIRRSRPLSQLLTSVTWQSPATGFVVSKWGDGDWGGGYSPWDVVTWRVGWRERRRRGLVVVGSKRLTWQPITARIQIWDAAGRGTGRWSHNQLNIQYLQCWHGAVDLSACLCACLVLSSIRVWSIFF